MPVEAEELGPEGTDVHDLFHLAVDLQPVPVEQHAQIVQAEVGGGHRRFPDLALLNFTVPQQGINPRGFTAQASRQGQADGLGQPLAERTGTDFDPGGFVHIGVSLQMTAEATQGFQIGGGEIAGLGEAGIKGRSRVPLGQNEAVPIFPTRVARVVPHFVKIENGQNIDRRKAPPGVPGPGGVEHFEDFNPKLTGCSFQVAYGLFIQHLAAAPLDFRPPAGT